MSRQTIPFGEIFEPARRQTVGDAEVPIMSITMADGLVDQADRFKKRIASADISGYKLVQRNQLVVGFPINEGVIAFQRKYDEAGVSPAYGIWDVRENVQIDHVFVERMLRSPQLCTRYEAKMRGTAGRRRNLPKDELEKVPIPLPPLAEQKRIAGILDAADTLRAKRRDALAHLDNLLQSTFLDMFGDPVTNPMRWEEKPFGTFGSNSFRNGLSPSSKGTVKGEVLTLSAITGASFDFTERKEASFDKEPSPLQKLTTATFLICRGNGNKKLVGAAAFPDREDESVCFPDTMIGVTIDPANLAPAYLRSIWRSRRVRRQIESGARTTNGTHKVNQKLLASVVIPVPPLDLQRRFAAIVESVEQHKARMRAHLTELDALFASLQSRAFNGEL